MLILIVAAFGLPSARSAQLAPIVVAPGFEFNVFADQFLVPDFSSVAGPTALAFDKRGRLFVATLSGKILILLDNNDDGVVDQVKTFARVPMPLGITFRDNGDLFATSNVFSGPGRILRLRDADGDDAADQITVIVDNLPSSGEHQTNRLRFGPDGLLYFGQGSATDNGTPKPGRPEEDPLNAKILRVDVNAPNPIIEVFASGLRNPFGMAFHPENGQLFVTDGGSGEVCQFPPCPPDSSPPEEINWVVAGGNYGFPQCEGTPSPDRPECAGVRAPIYQFSPHLTPVAITFYTGPQAGEDKNQMLVLLFKRLRGEGGRLLRFSVSGDASSGFQLTNIEPAIVDFRAFDPFDGPIDVAIDPISGDIYAARLDVVTHALNPNEHHNFIYRIYRAGSASQPFIGPVNPSSILAGSGPVRLSLLGRRLKPGAVVLADGVELATQPGSSAFELSAELPASFTASPRTIQVQVRNPDGKLSNAQQVLVTEPPPRLDSLTVTKRGRVVSQLFAGAKAKKFRLVARGSNFDPGAQLLANGFVLELESASSAELVGKLVQELLASPGQITVQVRNSTGKLSNPLSLTVAQP